jgi:hypothetical protein
VWEDGGDGNILASYPISHLAKEGGDKNGFQSHKLSQNTTVYKIYSYSIEIL